MPFRLNDFDFPIDKGLIAQRPADRRDLSRLMVLDRSSATRKHKVFSNLPDLLRPGDLLVLNNTRVIPARFEARRPTGGKIEGLFLHEPAPGQWQVMLRGAGKCRPDEELDLLGGRGARLRLVEHQGQGKWLIDVDPPERAAALLEHAGTTPLPPYIRRPDKDLDDADRNRYQTVYARHPGAVAAPTAGLHFTDEVFERLAARGIGQAYVTLHVGPGTFEPVRGEDFSRHEMHAEWYDLPDSTARAVNEARDQGRRVLAVGTTAVRVLESAARQAAGPLTGASGWTRLFLHPPAEFRIVDALLTNFHLPGSTLLMLVAAFCQPGGEGGLDIIRSAYADAVSEQYRFYSYGDAMLIE